MTETPNYAEGGFIPGPSAHAVIHPDECIVTPRDGAVGAICHRPKHPTPTSDCARVSWISHESQATS